MRKLIKNANNFFSINKKRVKFTNKKHKQTLNLIKNSQKTNRYFHPTKNKKSINSYG